MAPPFSGSKKRSLEMVVYDAAAATNKRAREGDEEETSTSSSANAASLVLRAASAPPPFGDLELEPISAVPISAVPPQLPPRALFAGREEPPCLRKHFLPALGLRADLPVHFIDGKRFTATDLSPHQSRFRIPTNGAIYRLRPLLTPAELHNANLLVLPTPKPKSRSKKQQPAESQNGGGETNKKIKKPKAKGMVHGGMRVKLVDLTAGAKELLLSRWQSTRATIVKGEGYLDFVRRCGFKEKDAVEVWAFVQRRVRIFGADVCDGSLLHVLIVKKDEQPPRCRYCPLPPAPADEPAPAVNPSIVSSR